MTHNLWNYEFPVKDEEPPPTWRTEYTCNCTFIFADSSEESYPHNNTCPYWLQREMQRKAVNKS